MDLADLILILGGLGGLATAVAALVTARRAARKTDVEGLALELQEVRKENARLRAVQAEMQAIISGMRADEIDLRERVRVLECENSELRAKLTRSQPRAFA